MASALFQSSFARIILLWGAGLGAAAQYAKISVIYDLLPTVYPDAGGAMGFIVSIVGFVGIVFGVVAGSLVSRIGYRRALIWALAVGAVLSCLQAVLPPLPVMLLLRVLEGVSHLAIVVAAPTLIAQLAPPAYRGMSLTLWGTFFGVAFTGLVWFGRPLVFDYGIPALFLAHGIWMAIFAGVMALVLARDPAKPVSLRLSWSGVFDDHKRLYASPFTAAPGLGWLFYTFCFLSLLTLLPPYMADSQRSFVLATMPLVSIAVSMTVGVAALRFLTAVQVVIVGFALVLVTLIWLLVQPGGAAACLALAGALGLVQGASFAAVPQLNSRAEDQALANGAMAQMGNIGNTLGTPVLAAVLLSGGYPSMMWSTFVMIFGGLLIHVWLARRRAYLTV